MVSGRELALFDKLGITEQLFSVRQDLLSKASTSAISNVPEPEIFHFHTKGDCYLTCCFYNGKPENAVILYFPAEYDSPYSIGILAKAMNGFGINFISMNYRTNCSEKKCHELAPLFQDAEAFFEYTLNFISKNKMTGKVVIMGRSLGSGAALNTAYQHQEEILCLILESGFDKTCDFLSGKDIKVDLTEFEEDPFDNRSKMSKFKKPVMFIHSPRDTVQSTFQIEWLVAESRSKSTQFQLAPSGTREELSIHGPEIYAETLKDYINMRQGIRPESRRRSKRRVKSGYIAEGFVKLNNLYD